MATDGFGGDTPPWGSGRQAEVFVGLREVCFQAEAAMAALTPRERQVFDLVAKGLTNKEVAQQIGCSPRTVENHRRHVVMKLDAGNAAEFATIAVYAALADTVRALSAVPPGSEQADEAEFSVFA